MSKLNRTGYEQLIAEDLVWLSTLPPCLERHHIILVLQESIRQLYPQDSDWDVEAVAAATWLRTKDWVLEVMDFDDKRINNRFRWAVKSKGDGLVEARLDYYTSRELVSLADRHGWNSP